jgi:hypothetical protein
LTYRKPVRQSYAQVRRKPTTGSRLKAVSTSTSKRRLTGAPAFSTGQQRFTANLMDLTRFLARYLSGKSNVMVTARKGTQGYSVGRTEVKGKDFYNINVPNWQTYDLPLKGFDKYRIYRSGLWHESMHAKHTPDEVFTHGRTEPVEHDIINVIEDRRIEDLGVEEWRGYPPERIYTNAYGYSLRPDVGDMWQDAQKTYTPGLVKEREEAKARYEAFLQKLIVGKIKGEGKLPKAEREKINAVAEKVEKDLAEMKKHKDDHGKIYDWLANLTSEVIRDLDLRSHTPDRVPDQPEGSSSWDDTFTEEYAKQQKAEPKDVEEGMDEYFDEAEKEAKPAKPEKEPTEEKPAKEEAEEETEKTTVTREDVQKAKEGTDQVEKEYTQVQKDEIDDTPVFAPLATTIPPELYRDHKFITKMNTSLREWKTGRKEVVGECGARLSIPQYIRHKEEPFVTRIRKSARGRKILVVADFSGSMQSREEDYKKAIISSMEVLDGIGSKTALFGFGGEKDSGDKFFFRIKRFEEPKWKPDHSAKTAALVAHYGSTPTANAYVGLEGYVKKHRPDVTVTITDGEPDDPQATAEIVKNFKRYTRMVAFGIESDYMPAQEMERTLKEFGYHKVFSAENVHEIPPKLVRLMAPT